MSYRVYRVVRRDVERRAESERRFARILDAIRTIRDGGYAIEFVDYCEDARTPGLLGSIAGVTDRERRVVKIGLVVAKREGFDAFVEILEHEARHVAEPEWDCGNRDVFGRGGPA